MALMGRRSMRGCPLFRDIGVYFLPPATLSPHTWCIESADVQYARHNREIAVHTTPALPASHEMHREDRRLPQHEVRLLPRNLSAQHADDEALGKGLSAHRLRRC